MISLNEAHNMRAVIENLRGFAAEVFLVDSYSSDETVDIALSLGVHVVQRRFSGFGDQWNYALEALPINAPWTMKLDPDERLSNTLKRDIRRIIAEDKAAGFRVCLRLWFMGAPMPVRQMMLRGWRTGACTFGKVLVNEQPIVSGAIHDAQGDLEHHDSPDLHHWFDKQNRYSSAEALISYRGSGLSVAPKLFGTALERRMWLKSRLVDLPARSFLVFLYCYVWRGAWRAGRIGYTWASMRVLAYRMWALKVLEMRLRGRELSLPPSPRGAPHPGALQAQK